MEIKKNDFCREVQRVPFFALIFYMLAFELRSGKMRKNWTVLFNCNMKMFIFLDIIIKRFSILTKGFAITEKGKKLNFKGGKLL